MIMLFVKLILSYKVFSARDDWRYLKYAFRAHNATLNDDHQTLELISENRGMRRSVMNELPGWLPSGSALVDFMHCVMVGKSNQVFVLLVF